MAQPKIFLHKFVIAVFGAALLGSACTPVETLIASPTTSAPSPVTSAATACAQTLVPPEIMEIQPPQPVAGSEITIIGSGGYLQDTCGGFIEGAGSFRLYLDNEPLGEVSCYVNRCEGKATLPDAIATGAHCLSTEPDTCPFEFQVTSN